MGNHRHKIKDALGFALDSPLVEILLFRVANKKLLSSFDNLSIFVL
jgi:hypothetical protein